MAVGLLEYFTPPPKQTPAEIIANNKRIIAAMVAAVRKMCPKKPRVPDFYELGRNELMDFDRKECSRLQVSERGWAQLKTLGVEKAC